jgi:hypothetical protein
MRAAAHKGLPRAVIVNDRFVLEFMNLPGANVIARALASATRMTHRARAEVRAGQNRERERAGHSSVKENLTGVDRIDRITEFLSCASCPSLFISSSVSYTPSLTLAVLTHPDDFRERSIA